jgi:hypothetical protein
MTSTPEREPSVHAGQGRADRAAGAGVGRVATLRPGQLFSNSAGDPLRVRLTAADRGRARDPLEQYDDGVLVALSRPPSDQATTFLAALVIHDDRRHGLVCIAAPQPQRVEHAMAPIAEDGERNAETASGLCVCLRCIRVEPDDAGLQAREAAIRCGKARELPEAHAAPVPLHRDDNEAMTAGPLGERRRLRVGPHEHTRPPGIGLAIGSDPCRRDERQDNGQEGGARMHTESIVGSVCSATSRTSTGGGRGRASRLEGAMPGGPR